MVSVEVRLPEDLASEAEAAGLLRPEIIAGLLREEVRRHRIDQMFETADRLAALNATPVTEKEVEFEIAAVRATRRALDASRR